MQDFHAAGGLPALLAELAPLLDPSPVTVTGRSLGEIAAAAAPPKQGGAIRRRDDPLRTGGAFAVVRGSLAPDGAVIKVSAATPALLRHRGRAVVFHGYADMRQRVDDPDLPVTPDSVLVLGGCGPVGVPGMPEWGMIPIPAKLATAGVTDMVRVTDARMSGTSFGTVFLHAAPEAAIGGPLALVRDGDLIAVDAAAGTLDLEVPAAELARRGGGMAPAALAAPARLARARTATTYCRRPRAATWTSSGPRRRTPPVHRASGREVLKDSQCGHETSRHRRKETAVRRLDTGGGHGRDGPARRRVRQRRK